MIANNLLRPHERRSPQRMKMGYFQIRGKVILLAALASMITGCWAYQSKPDDKFMPDDNSIRDIAIQDNIAWICGHNRLDRVDLSNGSIKDMNPPYFSCDHLLIAKNQWIWAYRETVQFYDGKEWHILERDPGAYSPIYAVTETSDGAIWISSSTLTQYDAQTGKTKVLVPARDTSAETPEASHSQFVVAGPNPGHIGPVFEATDGALWFNEQFDGITRWDKVSGAKEQWGSNDGFGGDAPIPTKFVQSRDGSIWVGTITGVYRFQQGKWQSWEFPMKGGKELGDFWVLDLLEDKQGKIWVVYAQAGVMVWDGSNWRDVGDFAHDQPITIFQDSKGHIWIGFEYRGAVRYDGESVKNYSQNILTFAETADHRLFGGGREGLFLYNRESDQWEKYPPSR